MDNAGILSKFQWSYKYEASHPMASGAACLCLEPSSLNEEEKEGLRDLAIAGMCWQEALPLGGIWHLTPLGAANMAKSNQGGN